MEQNFNVWFPKCMIQLYFPAPQFMTTFSLFLTMDRHFFFFLISGQDLNEEHTLYPVGCQKHLLRGSASPSPWCVLG